MEQRTAATVEQALARASKLLEDAADETNLMLCEQWTHIAETWISYAGVLAMREES